MLGDRLRCGTGRADTRPVIGAAFSVTLASAQGGDEMAFACLFRDVQPALLRYLQVITPEADDVAGDTWLQVVKGLPGFRGGEEAFRAWLFTIARQALHHLQPGVPGHVLRLGRDHLQVPQQRGLNVAEQARESHLIAPLGAGQRDAERGTDHRASIGPARPAAQKITKVTGLYEMPLLRRAADRDTAVVEPRPVRNEDL